MKDNFYDNVSKKIAESGAERISNDRVVSAVNKVKSRFEVPREAEQKALTSQVWLVDRKVFGEYTELYLKSIGMDFEEENRPVNMSQEMSDALGIDITLQNNLRLERLQKIREHLQLNQGIAFPVDGGGSVILINKDDCEDIDTAVAHETIHAMVDEPLSENYSREKGGFESRKLNEAVVQLMTLCSVKTEMTTDKILSEIQSGKMQTAYVNEIHTLGLALYGTKIGGDKGNFISFEKVVETYFDQEMPPGAKEQYLKLKIANSLPEQALGKNNFRESVLKMFDTLLK